MTDALDAMMGFDPSNLDAFANNDAPKTNPLIYKTNPKDSKSEDGVYRSTVRCLYNPYDYNKSVVQKTEWYCKGTNGSFVVNTPLDTKENNRTNPLAQASSKAFLALDGFAERFADAKIANPAQREEMLREFNAITGKGKEVWTAKFKGTELGKKILEYAKDTFDHTTSTWVPVQVMEDENKPELVGQILMMKVPSAILKQMNALMNPSEEDRKKGAKPVALLSWATGFPLEMKVEPGPDDPTHPERKQREISYDLCKFSADFEPIRKVDGTPLYTDEQLELLEEYTTAVKDAATAKSATKKAAAAAKIAVGSDLYNKVRELTGIALNYLKDEVKMFNIVDEIVFNKERYEAQMPRIQEWINEVLFITPTPTPANNTEETEEDTATAAAPVIEEPADAGLPF